jgi:hypothetical protein
MALCFLDLSKFIPEKSVRIDLQTVGVALKKVTYVAFNNEELRQTTLVILNE